MAVNMKCPHSGKDIHFSEDAAHGAAKMYARKRGSPPLFVYRCPDCGYHHLTKIKQQKNTAEMFKTLVGRP